MTLQHSQNAALLVMFCWTSIFHVGSILSHILKIQVKIKPEFITVPHSSALQQNVARHDQAVYVGF